MATGHCLCGGVEYRVDGPLRDVHNCHCEHCRRTTGHFMAASAAASDDLTLVRDETLRWYSHQPNVEYGFCNRCGASLFWRSEGTSTVSIAAGTIDPPTGLTTVASLFDAEASDYFELPSVDISYPGDRPLP